MEKNPGNIYVCAAFQVEQCIQFSSNSNFLERQAKKKIAGGFD